MTIEEKIDRARARHITAHGLTPSGLLIGSAALAELQMANPDRYIAAGVNYRGMRIIVDGTRLDRAEVGDFTV